MNPVSKDDDGQVFVIPRTTLVQLADDTPNLPAQYEVGLDSYVTRNLILLTPVKIGLHKSPNSADHFPSQHPSPFTKPTSDHELNPPQSKEKLKHGPNPISPKTSPNPQQSSKTDHSNQIIQNPQNQNTLTVISEDTSLES